MRIGNVWAENAFVIKANIVHEKVHDSNNKTYSKDKKRLNAVAIYNDDYDLYGVTDCIELHKSKKGVEIDAQTYTLMLVEFKPTQPKNDEFNFADAMQVFAQKICVDYVFKTNCEAYLYYADTRKRVKLPFEKEFELYEKELRRLMDLINFHTEKNEIPPIEKDQKCSGCSFKDLCMPHIKRQKSSKAKIYASLEDDT